MPAWEQGIAHCSQSHKKPGSLLLPSVLSAEQILLTLLLALVMCPGPWPTVLRIPPLQHELPFGQDLHIESYFLF